MKEISKSQVFNIIKQHKNDLWSCRTVMNGKGEYGYDATYYCNGTPLFMLSVAFSEPYTKAYDLR